ncbi:MAG: thioesterase family protein [Natronomonas sp.]
MQTVYENTVRMAETDAEGVVFYGNYATYLDESFTAYLEAIGYPYESILDGEWSVRVAHLELDYHRSAAFRDRLDNRIRVAAIGDSSIRMAYECRRQDDDALLAEGEAVYVAVSADGDETTRVPAAFRDAVVAFQTDPPETV